MNIPYDPNAYVRVCDSQMSLHSSVKDWGGSVYCSVQMELTLDCILVHNCIEV